MYSEYIIYVQEVGEDCTEKITFHIQDFISFIQNENFQNFKFKSGLKRNENITFLFETKKNQNRNEVTSRSDS